jgi:hypothetical protein
LPTHFVLPTSALGMMGNYSVECRVVVRFSHAGGDKFGARNLLVDQSGEVNVGSHLGTRQRTNVHREFQK